MGNCSQLTEVIPLWKEQIIDSYTGDMEMQELITEATVDKSGPKEYCFSDGLLKYRGKWVVGTNGGLRRQIFEELHGGHSGGRATIKRVLEDIYWPNIRQKIGLWVK